MSELGEWGPIVNGGAWLTIDSTPVDVLFRDLDTVESWLGEAQQGRFEVLSQTGYLVGAPTYLPVGELAICQPIAGEVPRPRFPEPLAATAATRWKGRAQVSPRTTRLPLTPSVARACSPRPSSAWLMHGSPSATNGCSTRNVSCSAALGEVQATLASPGATCAELAASVATVGTALRVEPLTAR